MRERAIKAKARILESAKVVKLHRPAKQIVTVGAWPQLQRGRSGFGTAPTVANLEGQVSSRYGRGEAWRLQHHRLSVAWGQQV